TTTRGATAIAIRSGEERAEVNVHLTPVPGVEVSGTLLDAGGPVSGFGVHLLPGDDGDGMSVLEVAATSTDARGAFVFPVVPSGNYTLLAMRTAPAPGQGPTTVSESPGAWASQSMTVGSDQVSNLVLTLGAGIQIGGRV